ncbi:MAG: HPr(Ser) kinase/phosphatase [Deltaproteobacteria bacterium]|nr:HPr(Ser) kinase/phosphatase [Deltaproteobacteria bacterium]
MVTISELLQARGEAWKLTLVAGAAGLGNGVAIPRIQKPGLALAGYLPQIHPERVQVIGRTELGYLATLGDEAARRAVDRVLGERLACLIVSNGTPPPAYFAEAAERHRVPLVTSELKSSELIRNVTAWLEDRLAPHTLIHGVLVEVFGLGVLLLGKSGIGKSEAALDLVTRGHRLVADDVVEARVVGAGRVIGSGAELIRHHMEIRGLGIINVQDLFGIMATLHEKAIQLVAEMFDWSKEERADRLGLEDETHAILDVTLPKVRIPIRPGRSVATIIEVAARNHVLKRLGRHSAREVAARLDSEIARRRRRAAPDETGPRASVANPLERTPGEGPCTS